MRKTIIYSLFLILSTVLLVSVAAFAADEEMPLESGQEQESEMSVPAIPSKPVTGIEIKGNKNISTNTIVSKMKTRIGAPYRENVISDDLKRLYLLGFFSDIKIDTEDYNKGIKIIITVSERPIIEKITFTGITRLIMKDEKLKIQLKSKEGQYLDYPSLAEDIRTLKKLYEKIGFAKVEMKYEVDINKETSKANVQFKVNEGRRVRIKDILIEGNKAFPGKRILKLIKTRRAWFFNAGVLKDEVLTEDIERIKTFYRNAGFVDVTVGYEVKPDKWRPYLLYIHIKIQEGQKYLVGNVTIRGNSDITEKDILVRLRECTPGRIFSQDALRQDIANIQALYFDRGYISCQIQEAVSLNPEIKRVDIVYNIVENKVSYVEKVKIRGNIKTKDVVIRREMRLKPGDRFDGEKLKRSKERLQNLGFFEEVNYDVEGTAVEDRKDLVVEVKETKTGAFSFGGGYSSVDELVGFVEIEQKNFDWKNWPYFTGDGQNLKLRASLGTVSEGFDLSFTEPWMFDYPVSFGFDAYKRIHKRETDIGYGYDEDITGFDLRLGKEISEYLREDLTYRRDNINISNITSDATNDLKKEDGTNVVSSLQYALTFDSRDNIFDPTKGNLITGSIESAGGPLGGTKDFWKFFGRASHYFPFFRGSVLEVRGRLGLAANYAGSDDIPIYERFFTGGAYTVRGYRERKIGPFDPVSKDPLGGNAMLVGNIEYTYPLFNFLRVALFIDTGNAWEKVGKLGSGGLKSSTGLGLRIKTPIGPIMLDYGVPFNKESGESDKSSGRFHFSMSQGF